MMKNSITISKSMKILNSLQTESIFFQMHFKVFHRSLPNQNYNLIVKNIYLKDDKNTPNSHRPNQKPNKQETKVNNYNNVICKNPEFDILDANKDILYIKSYGISVTILEEAFLKIEHDREEGDNISDDDSKIEFNDNIGMDAKDKLEAQNQYKQPTISGFALKDQKSFEIFFIHIYAVLYKRFWWSLRDFKALLFIILSCIIIRDGVRFINNTNCNQSTIS